MIKLVAIVEYINWLKNQIEEIESKREFTIKDLELINLLIDVLKAFKDSLGYGELKEKGYGKRIDDIIDKLHIKKISTFESELEYIKTGKYDIIETLQENQEGNTRYPLPKIQQKILKSIREEVEYYYGSLASHVNISTTQLNVHLDCLEDLGLIEVFMKNVNGYYQKYVKLRNGGIII